MGERDQQPSDSRDRAAVTVTISLPSDATAAAIARQFVADNRDHIQPALIEDAQLLVSEIVTNAVRHGRPDITLTVRIDPPSIGVAVGDRGDEQPAQPQNPRVPSQTSGRGLLIVDALASAWGVMPNADPLPGKVIWFEIDPRGIPDATD